MLHDGQQQNNFKEEKKMANKNIITMKSIEEGSIRIYSGMIAVWPQLSNYEDVITVDGLSPKFNGCYAANNSTMIVVASGSEILVTPYMRDKEEFLKGEGFYKKDFYVPFSNGEYPKKEKEKWKSLCREAEESRAEEFTRDSISYCEKNHIGKLSEDIINKCFEMPSTGVQVRNVYYEDRYYPVINSKYLDRIDLLGCFCYNNGKVIFVYRNGKTYVAKGYKLIEKLEEAGYTKFGMFVPFSNGEEILDPFLKRKWESIPKIS